MSEDLVRGWMAVYPHLRYESPQAAIAWLSRAFGFRERVRMARPDGSIITCKLETPGGGLVMIAGHSPDFTQWMRARVPDFREPQGLAWPHLTHTVTVMMADVDSHYQQAKAAGATILMPPTSHPWGLRTYAAIDLEGHQWEFAQTLRLTEPEEWGASRVG